MKCVNANGRPETERARASKAGWTRRPSSIVPAVRCPRPLDRRAAWRTRQADFACRRRGHRCILERRTPVVSLMNSANLQTRSFIHVSTCIKDRVCNPKTERVHPDGAMPAGAAVVLHEGRRTRSARRLYTREDEIDQPPIAASWPARTGCDWFALYLQPATCTSGRVASVLTICKFALYLQPASRSARCRFRLQVADKVHLAFGVQTKRSAATPHTSVRQHTLTCAATPIKAYGPATQPISCLGALHYRPETLENPRPDRRT